MLRKKRLFLMILLLFSTIRPAEKNYNYYITGAIAALYIGKLSYNYFQNHYITPEQTIQQCQSTFKIIQQDIKLYHKFYRNDAQMSNWELKEIILDCNSKNPYPFLEYYTSLQQALLLLQKHHIAIITQIDNLQRYEKKLQYKNMALKLKQEGKSLKQQISKIISLITILRMRIKLFKEYHEDCYYSQKKVSNS